MRRFTALVFILALVTAACGGGAELEVATETTATQPDAHDYHRRRRHRAR